LIDEITNGLDVQGIELCEQLLKSELAEKVRILVSHDQNFVAKLNPTILELPGST
jgi:ATPase subunit of ABC transporter with duplicated ATPase domains